MTTLHFQKKGVFHPTLMFSIIVLCIEDRLEPDCFSDHIGHAAVAQFVRCSDIATGKVAFNSHWLPAMKPSMYPFPLWYHLYRFL